MKYKVRLLVTIFILLVHTSCKKDFLEVIDTTVLLKQGYVTDLRTTGQFMNGVYNLLGTSYYAGNAFPYADVMADNMKPVATKNIAAAYNWNFSSSSADGSGDPVQSWKRFYNIIRNCNFVIEKATEFKSENDAKANEITGQALAIRAMVQLTLCNMFAQPYNFTPDGAHAGIPYPKTSGLQEPVSRISVAQVYSNLIEDLQSALKLLPVTVNFTRELMNYQSAKALLARVYLFKEDFTAAKDLSRQVLADVPMLLPVDYPQKMYTAQDPEALYRVPPYVTNISTSAVLGFYVRSTGALTFVATADIASLLKEDISDKRSNWVKDTLGTWQIRKFPLSAAGLSTTSPALDYYQSVFRSSEMCLTAAESYARLNKEDSARFFIDMIRLRANPTTVPITATGGALLDSIYKERRKEMCFDGNTRAWDLRRWKKAIERMDTNNPNAQILPYPSDKAIAAIPITDVQLGGLQQNPGY